MQTRHCIRDRPKWASETQGRFQISGQGYKYIGALPSGLLFFSFLEYILRGKHGSERIEYFTGVKREIINTLSPITNKSTMSENPSIRNALFIVSDVLIHFTPRGVGCIFYEMATGRPLFPGSTVEDQLHLIFKVCTVLL